MHRCSFSLQSLKEKDSFAANFDLMRKVQIIGLFTCFLTTVYAQQEPMSTQFRSTMLNSNPAIAGLDYLHEANVLYRSQWVNVNGSPNTLFANYAYRSRKLHGAVGFSYMYDVIGFNKEHKLLLHYAYHQPITRALTVSGGVSVGMGFFKLDSPNWITSQSLNDPSLPGTSNDAAFHVNTGIVFKGRKWKLGASMTQINEPVYHLKNVDYYALRHTFIFGEYRFKLSEKLFVIPAAKWYAVDKFYTFTGMTRVEIGNLWTGISYSQHDLRNYIGGMIGYDFKGKYRIGYSYDYTTNALQNVSYGTHEVTMAFLMLNVKPNIHSIPGGIDF